MTFRDLKRFISDYSSNSNSSHDQEIELLGERFAIFENKPFWISNINEHKKADIANKGACCFNHIIGLPKNNGQQVF